MIRVEITEVKEILDEGASRWLKLSDEGTKNYGYVTHPEVRTVERVLLKQELETVSIPAVIRAINGL